MIVTATAAPPAMLLALQGPQLLIPPGLIEIAESFFVMIAVIALGVPIVRAMVRRWEHVTPPPAQFPSDVTHRLERIEQAVDSIAIEMERVSEAQRFQSKLMAEHVKALPRAE